MSHILHFPAENLQVWTARVIPRVGGANLRRLRGSADVRDGLPAPMIINKGKLVHCFTSLANDGSKLLSGLKHVRRKNEGSRIGTHLM